jgi:dTDP-4-amino-4,6-dideoxygalactose transaminase
VLNAAIPYVRRLRSRFPRLYAWLVSLARRFLRNRLGIYPRPLGGEVEAAARVLRSGQWNMCYSGSVEHEKLEKAFAAFTGVEHAIAVNTGGMALQMALRGLGLGFGDEAIVQVDTCSAGALAVMAAGCTPVFCDVDAKTFMLDAAGVASAAGPKTKAIIATHMWGNPEDLDAVGAVCEARGVPLVEDACLSLGAVYKGRRVGSVGKVGVFSFGCLKPIQGGEGGMITTNDGDLARELRAMRHWGDRTIEYGTRDTLRPAWNGRMSEIVAAIVLEQLQGYPQHFERMRESVHDFQKFLASIEGLTLHLGGAASIDDCVFTQVTMRLNAEAFGMTKTRVMEELGKSGVAAWHANFEPITSLSLFRTEAWRPWLPCADQERVSANFRAPYPRAEALFASEGLGLGKANFLSKQNYRYMKQQLESLCRKAR